MIYLPVHGFCLIVFRVSPFLTFLVRFEVDTISLIQSVTRSLVCFFLSPTDPVFLFSPFSLSVVVVVLISTFVGRETRRLDFGPDFYRFSFVLFFFPR